MAFTLTESLTGRWTSPLHADPVPVKDRPDRLRRSADSGQSEVLSIEDRSRGLRLTVSAFAEFEGDRIGERIRATKRAQKARGEYLGGRPPFGYSYDADRRLVP